MSDNVRIEPVPEKGFFDNIFPRQVGVPTGVIGWLTTVDHKRIGILYGVTALLWFLVGGLEALTIRMQLMRPDQHIVSAETYNQLFTMHGTTMIFLVVMPLAAGFFNYLVPLLIGARDVAFPRLNAFSYWMFLFASLLLNSSWLIGHAPNQGWFGYAPLTEKQFNPGYGVDFWILGLQMLGVASVVASLNFIVTIINLRAPGMSFMRLPVFVWMTLVTNFLVVLAFPVITIALAELMFDRTYDTHFFQQSQGGMAILWQHLFWVFGHPEVYILILPPMGIVSEILPVFSRRPLFGYPLVVGSGVAIGFMGFTVWAHHMFTTGMGNIANAAFTLTTMSIAVPTGVKIINWVGTLYGGQLRMRTPMLFCLGFIYQFMMGGFSGLMHANAAHDAQQQDTYFVVAHFHYVLIGGAIFGLFAGIYYWYPKIVGRMLNETRGHVVFWLLFLGFNVTFFPMHWLGLNGMPRRIYTYDSHLGWNDLNMLCTAGAGFMAIAILILFVDMFFLSRTGGEIASADPWDGRTMEWMIPSPPPAYNFKEIPVAKGRDALWLEKYPQLLLHEGHHGEDELGDVHEVVHEAHGGHDHGLHMPGGSWFPMFASAGLILGAFGLIMMGGADYTAQYQLSQKAFEAKDLAMHANEIFWFWVKVAVSGLGLGVLGIFCWGMEPIGGYYVHFEDEAKHEH